MAYRNASDCVDGGVLLEVEDKMQPREAGFINMSMSDTAQ